MSDDPLTRLLAARERPRRIVIGLLSGTSADGVHSQSGDVGSEAYGTGSPLAIAPYSAGGAYADFITVGDELGRPTGAVMSRLTRA